jgi:hypothetical protein
MSKQLTQLQQIEAFHAALLGELRLPRGHAAVKGGANLRLFHGSPRMSKDLDIDLDARTPAPKTLASNVTKLLQSTTLKARLARIGLSIEGFSAPKQTDVVQRWKVSLKGPAGVSPTKLEFSRRGLEPGVAIDSIDAGLTAAYSLPGALVEHYDRPTAYAQKVRALARRAEPQARDVFDLHILGPGQPDLAGLDPALREAAHARLAELSFADFRSQVVPTLATAAAEHYDDESVWEALVTDVARQLKATR